MGFGNTGKVWTPASLKEYLKTVSRPLWVRGITLHHCAEPSLAQRPDGFKAQHIQNLKDFYQHEKGWSSGPHLFIDEDQVWGLCPFNELGVHAVSFNRDHLGIEVLGDYDSEDPRSGRGLACWETTFACVKVLLEWLGLPCNESTVNFHRDDPKTSKTCPGTKVDKQWVIGGISGQVSSAPNPHLIEWVVQYPSAYPIANDMLRFSAFQRIDRPFVGTRYAIEKLGGDPNKIKVVDGEFTYDGKDLEHSYINGGTGYSPVREITDALGLKIVSVIGRTITVGK